MKRKIFFLLGIIFSGILGWTFGFLRLPFIERNYSFWMGFLACLALVMVIGLIFLLSEKNAHLLQDLGKNTFLSKVPRSYALLISLVSLTIIIGSLLSAFFIQEQNRVFKTYIQRQNEHNILQLEHTQAAQRANAAILMNDLYERIETELNNSPGRKLSMTTIERVADIARFYTPYSSIGEEMTRGKKLSKERGALLVLLSKIEMDSSSFALLKSHTTFSGADLRKADLAGADLSGADLTFADLKDADLSSTTLNGANLKDANLHGAIMNQIQAIDVNFQSADLSWVEANGGHFVASEFNGAMLLGAKLRRANFNKAQMFWAKLNGAFLNEADFTQANLLATDLGRANLSYANFTGADATVTNFSEAIMQETDLTDVIAYRAFTDVPDWYDKLRKWNVKGVDEIEAEYEILVDVEKMHPYRLTRIEQ